MSEPKTDEEIIEEFKQTNIYRTARVSGYGKKMEDYLRTTLAAVREEERERIKTWALSQATVAPCHLVIRNLLDLLTPTQDDTNLST